MNEEKLLRRVKWQYMVLDEAQAIKSSSRWLYMVNVCVHWFVKELSYMPSLAWQIISAAASAGRHYWASTVGTVYFLLGHQYKTIWLSYGHFSISSCPLYLTAMNSSTSGSQRGTVFFLFLFLVVPSLFCPSLSCWCFDSIEGHAEHGGALNEHQLSRLVRHDHTVYVVVYWIFWVLVQLLSS